MIRAALKSLLGRKVRLLHEHLRDRARRRLRRRLAGLLRHAQPQLHRAVRLDRRRRRGAARGRRRRVDGAPLDATVPGRAGRRARATLPGAARVDGNVSAFGVFVVGEDGKVVGGFGPPAHRRQLDRRPGRARPRGPRRSPRVARRSGARRGGARRPHRRAGRLRRRRRGPAWSPRATRRTARAHAGRHRRLRRGRLAQRRDAGALRHRRPPRTSSSAARTPSPTSGSPPTDGVSQDELRDQVAAAAARRTSRRSPATTPPTTPQRACCRRCRSSRTFLLIFAGISLVVGAFLIVNTFSILVAQRSRELALLRALGASQRQVHRVGAARGVGARAARLDARASASGCCWRWGSGRCSRSFGLDLSGQPLVFAPRTVAGGVRRRRARHDGRGLRCPPGAPRGSRRSRRCATTWRCPSRRCGAASRSGPAARRRSAGRALALGLFADARRGAGWFVGGGVLRVLLGVAVASPVLSRPLLAAARAAYARALRHRSATWPARTPCATHGAPPRPPRR